MDKGSDARVLRSQRKETTQLSARKKIVFPKKQDGDDEDVNDDDDILSGIAPLQDNEQNIERNRKENNKTTTLRKTKNGKQKCLDEAVSAEKQQDELHNLLGSMELHENESQLPHAVAKRACSNKLMQSPPRKNPKLISNVDELSIPAKTFYSARTTSPLHYFRHLPFTSPSSGSPSPKSRRRARILTSEMNKGVRHKIRKRRLPTTHVPCSTFDVDKILQNLHCEKLRNLIKNKRQQNEQIEKVHRLFRSNKNPIEMAKPLRMLFVDDTQLGNSKNNNNNNNFNSGNKNDANESSFNTRRSPLHGASSPYDMLAFSDLDNSSSSGESDVETLYSEYTNEPMPPHTNYLEKEEQEEEVIPLIRFDGMEQLRSPTPTTMQRKFFKSGHNVNTRKEVKMNGNMRAFMHNGKLSLVERKRTHRRIKVRSKVNTFSDEQATVQAILETLDESVLPEQPNLASSECNTNAIATEAATETPQKQQLNSNTAVDAQTSVELCTDQEMPFASDEMQEQFSTPESPLLDLAQKQDMAEIQKQTKNTDDTAIVPQVIEEQQATDHEVVDQVAIEQFRQRIPYNTDDPELIQQQRLLLDFLIENSLCTERNFHIFIVDPANHKEEINEIAERVNTSQHDCSTDYREQIPCNTNDKKLIEQQHCFLDFLIDNGICSDETFDIFIANFTSRCNEAKHIVQTVLSLQASNVEQPFNQMQAQQLLQYFPTCYVPANMKLECSPEESCDTSELTNANEDEALLQSGDSINSSGSVAASILSSADLLPLQTHSQDTATNNTGGFYAIFNVKGYKPLLQQSTRRLQKYWQGGYGTGQYQIDAGQASFGARQCKHCGLVYTAHEAEEERLHRDYHTSLHVFRLNRWIDEDIVAVYPEWGIDGRILRITESSPAKRVQRIKDVLKVVDKELGFSNYIMPDTFVAFLAVRKNQIIGICLVQPLTRANKYTCIDGVDCCTEQTFEAKCGISRIWISPMQRRMHVGAKLFEAVQMNTIVGHEIPRHQIAFSAPTEMGKAFAQKVTKMENFLVYQ